MRPEKRKVIVADYRDRELLKVRLSFEPSNLPLRASLRKKGASNVGSSYVFEANGKSEKEMG